MGCGEEVGAAGVQSRRAPAVRQREACLLLQGEQSADVACVHHLSWLGALGDDTGPPFGWAYQGLSELA